MKIEYLLTVLLIFGILTLGCTQTAKTNVMEDKDSMQKKETSVAIIEGSDIGKDVSMGKEDLTTPSGYKGKILAGSETTMYLEFNKEDYEKALKEKKKILLYFYANWCPICKREQSETFDAFNEINEQNLIGFRVNYNDDKTDADEKALAKEFNVVYQHTKVILKDGKQIGKFPDSWNKERYLEELKKVQ